MLKVIFASLLASSLIVAADRGEEIKLWPNGAPGSEGITAPEVSKPSTNPKYAGWPSNFTVTHYPSIYVFLPPKEKATGAAMIVAPGGGHTQLVIEKEGWEFADWLNSNGIAAFVLKYRLAKAPGSKYTLPDQVYADAARSVRLVRSHAKEWGIDPTRIGFSGFSAGGEVAGMIETKFDAGKPDAEDPIERVSSRPGFQCPGLSLVSARREQARRSAAISRSQRCAAGIHGVRRRRPLPRGAHGEILPGARSQSYSRRNAHLRIRRPWLRIAADQEAGPCDGLAGPSERVARRAQYFPVALCYSIRIASRGSMDAALLAGRNAASMDTPASTATAAASVNTSRGLTPNRTDLINRSAPSVRINPAAIPARSNADRAREDQAHDLRPVRSERDADADLPRSRRHHQRDETVQADRGEQHRRRREHRDETRVEPGLLQRFIDHAIEQFHAEHRARGLESHGRSAGPAASARAGRPWFEPHIPDRATSPRPDRCRYKAMPRLPGRPRGHLPPRRRFHPAPRDQILRKPVNAGRSMFCPFP